MIRDSLKGEPAAADSKVHVAYYNRATEERDLLIADLKSAESWLKTWDDQNAADTYADKFVWEAVDVIRAALKRHASSADAGRPSEGT